MTVSTQTDLKEFAESSIQTEDTALPCTVRQLKEEIRVLKQRVKRQTISIKSLKDLLRTLRNKSLIDEDYSTFLTSHFKGEKVYCTS